LKELDVLRDSSLILTSLIPVLLLNEDFANFGLAGLEPKKPKADQNL
jgi:hypothetical protein